MQLTTFQIKNLRSIEQQTLRDCGQFNVFIGKNNSGKSNLLSGIASFFTFLGGENLAVRKGYFVSKDDHFMRDAERDIQLVGSLQIGQEHMAKLFAEIAVEFPQVQQAIPEAGVRDQLQVELVFRTLPEPMGFIRSISYQAADEAGNLTGNPRTLLELGDAVAEELASRESESRQLTTDIAQLAVRTFGDDDWSSIKQHMSVYLPSYYRELSPSQRTEIQRIVSRSSSASEANELVQVHCESLRDRAEYLETTLLTNSLKTFAGMTDTIPRYVVRIMQIFGGYNVLHLADRRRPIGAEEASRLLELKTSRGGSGTLRSIQQTVETLLGVEIDAFSSGKPQSNRVSARVRNSDAELDVGDFLVQVNGSGVREALRLILDLELQRSDLVLVEEPEIHLHPALEVAMMRHLKAVSGTTQVFLTTHSTNFLDTGDMRNVYMVRNQQSTGVQHLNVDDVEDELPKELGIRLSSVFMYDTLVFVEGLSDELTIRAFAQTLGYNLGQANVGFVVMGSARNFTHYAAQSTIALLTKRNVRSVFIIDKDERRQDQIDKMAMQLAGFAQLHVLKRREIENYLLSASAIVQFVTEKSWRGSRRSIIVTEAEVEGLLNEIADGLGELSVVKRVTSRLCGVHRVDRDTILANVDRMGIEAASDAAIAELETKIRDLRTQIGEIVQEAEREVTDSWAQERLNLAPGHELLDELMKRYGMRFNKDRDTGDLASLVEKIDIPPEISVIIGSVVAP